MNKELEAARDALGRDVAKAVAALSATIKSSATGAAPLTARSDAIRQEDERRARAGVRVSVNAGDFEHRRAVLLSDFGKHFVAQSGQHEEHATGMALILARALSLIAQLAEALDAPEHAAAVRAAAEDAAAKAAAAAKQRPIDERNARDDELARLVVLAAKEHQAAVAAGRTTADVWLR